MPTRTKQMTYEMMYGKFLKRLEEIREYEWNNYDIKVHEEYDGRKGVRHGENALRAIARHMTEVLEEEAQRGNGETMPLRPDDVSGQR